MEEKNAFMDSWEQTLRDKTKDELVSIIQHKEKYAPKFISMVEEKLEKDYGLKIVVPAPPVENTTIEKQRGSEWEVVKGTGGFLSFSKWLIACILVGFFTFLCAWQASYEFYWWRVLNGYWWVFAALCSFYVLFFLIKGEVEYYLNVKKNKKNNSSQNALLSSSTQIGARDLFLETLKKIGCQSEIDEEGKIRFMWQGGDFTAEADNDCPFIVIWYVYWGEYELYDIDTISRVKRVINDANITNNINVLYSINEAGSTFNVHSKKHFLYISQIPNIEEYLQSILGQFFQVRHRVESELIKLKAEEEKAVQ